MKMGGVELHQELRNLCANTDWNYAVFWKLRHQPRMMLTWEDAYYDRNDRSGSNWFDNMDNFQDEQYAQDLLGLAVGKMSYRVYPLGEGIVGWVAVTGKHLWISGDQLVSNLCYSDEHFDGWKTQFSAGIRTIVVVAVVPHGVVELGSFNAIAEDLKLVNHIREVFFELESCLMGSIDCSPCVSDLSTRSSGSGKFHERINNQDRTMANRSNMWMTVEMINDHREIKYPISDLLESPPCNDQHGNLSVPRTSNGQMLKNSEEDLGFQTETNESFKFPAGCELYEALGPAFCKQNDSFDWETVTTETLTVDGMPGGMSSSDLLTQISGSEHLLEAVVANVCCSDSGDKSAMSFGNSVKSLTQLQLPPSDLLSSGSACYSYERSFHDMTTNLEAYGSSQGFSSASVGRCSEQLERPREPAKAGKKRARPGESCRPRPRDRQLIQDRIKELRELVPNGSKCSIDSLLERTIKHMLFMQCITKHADKIDKCAEFKLLGKDTGVLRPSSHEQGSSWAMEVGNHLKVCPIIVENIGVNRQMLVEMMCDECVHFLEIAEAIRSLGLTILKGVTDAYGDKTWMCFVVEGENNRSMHRVDLLWSLVQILQSRTRT